jgi:hypothetical protein
MRRYSSLFLSAALAAVPLAASAQSVTTSSSAQMGAGDSTQTRTGSNATPQSGQMGDRTTTSTVQSSVTTTRSDGMGGGPSANPEMDTPHFGTVQDKLDWSRRHGLQINQPSSSRGGGPGAQGSSSDNPPVFHNVQDKLDYARRHGLQIDTTGPNAQPRGQGGGPGSTMDNGSMNDSGMQRGGSSSMGDSTMQNGPSSSSMSGSRTDMHR